MPSEEERYSPTEEDIHRRDSMPGEEEIKRFHKEQHSEVMATLRKEILQEMDRRKLGGQMNPVDIEYFEKDSIELEKAMLQKKKEQLAKLLEKANAITQLDLIKQIFKDIGLIDYKEVSEGNFAVLQFYRQDKMILFTFHRNEFQSMSIV